MPCVLRTFLEDSAADDAEAMAAAIWSQMAAHAVELMKAQPGSQLGRSGNIERGFQYGHQRIMLDYFWSASDTRPDGSNQNGPVYSEKKFERRFRMSREMFNRVFVATTADSEYLHAGLKPNCAGKMGASPPQKVVAALRQLAYGCSADSLDEYCRLGESTALLSMKEFCRSVVNCFQSEYLRDPNEDELKRIERQFASIGFPGCVGCLDCAGWQWGNCPKGLQGTMVGKDGVPTLRMEVIADLDLRIWHLSFGLQGVMNELNILSVSPYFGKIISGEYPAFEDRYDIGGEEFKWFYALKAYGSIQEGVRKSVERVFGVLFKQFSIMYLPGRLWFSDDMSIIAKACVILHNMTVEERRDEFVGDGIGGIRGGELEIDESFNLVPLNEGML